MQCGFLVFSFVSTDISVVAMIVLGCKWFILLYQLMKLRKKKPSWRRACMPESLSAFSSYIDLKDTISLANLAFLCKHVVG